MTYKDEWKKQLAGHAEIRELHERLRSEIAARYQRSLPFADELFDRWERAAQLGFGAGASIYDSSLVLGKVSVGENTWIGPFTILDGSAALCIGHHCSISAGVHIYSHDNVAWALTGGKAELVRAEVSIGDCTYIGPNAVIAAGVRVGKHCVIGAGALVNRDIPDFSIAYGLPARVVGRVELDGAQVQLIYDHDPKP